MIERGLDDLAHRNGGHIDRAAVDERAVERLALGVKAQQVHDLLLLADEARHQILRAFVGRVEDGLPSGAVHEMPPLHLDEQKQQVCGALADAVDLEKLGTRRLKHAREASEAAQERVRDLVRIPARNGVIERDLQHLHIGQAVHAAGFHLPAHPFAVAFMY